MDNTIASARLLRRSLLACAAGALLVAVGAPVTYAQQPKPVAQAPKPAQPAPAAQPQQGAAPQFIYTPWTKQCNKATDPNAKGGCITSKNSFADNGFPMSSVALIEPDGDKKILRVTVPEPVAIAPGMRLVVDQNQPVSSGYTTCFRGACMSEVEATADIITKMKTGQNLFVQAVTLNNQVANLPMPLADSKKSNEGAAVDPKVLEEQAKKFQEDLQRRAEEYRKQMEAQQAQQPQQPTR